MSDAEDPTKDEISEKIITTMVKNPGKEFNKKQLSEEAGISRDSLYRRYDTLEEKGIIEGESQGRAFKLNPSSKKLHAFIRYHFDEEEAEQKIESLKQLEDETENGEED